MQSKQAVARPKQDCKPSLPDLQRLVLGGIFSFAVEHRNWYCPRDPRHSEFWAQPPYNMKQVSRTCINQLAAKGLIITVITADLPGPLRVSEGDDNQGKHKCRNNMPHQHIFPSRLGLKSIALANEAESCQLAWARRKAKRLEEALKQPINRQYIRQTNVPDPARERAHEIALDRARHDSSHNPNAYMEFFVDELARQRARGRAPKQQNAPK